MAVARARQLAAALAAHGLAAPPRRLAAAGELLAGGKAHDATHVRMLRPPADLLPELDRPLSCGDLRSRYASLILMF